MGEAKDMKTDLMGNWIKLTKQLTHGDCLWVDNLEMDLLKFLRVALFIQQ